MALIATNVGWERNEQTGRNEFVVRLVAETSNDLDNMHFSPVDVWDAVPLVVVRKARMDAICEQINGLRAQAPMDKESA